MHAKIQIRIRILQNGHSPKFCSKMKFTKYFPRLEFITTTTGVKNLEEVRVLSTLINTASAAIDKNSMRKFELPVWLISFTVTTLSTLYNSFISVSNQHDSHQKRNKQIFCSFAEKSRWERKKENKKLMQQQIDLIASALRFRKISISGDF